jgi:hypothetical protein
MMQTLPVTLHTGATYAVVAHSASCGPRSHMVGSCLEAMWAGCRGEPQDGDMEVACVKLRARRVTSLGGRAKARSGHGTSLHGRRGG